jgi:hypothetical protein
LHIGSVIFQFVSQFIKGVAKAITDMQQRIGSGIMKRLHFSALSENLGLNEQAVFRSELSALAACGKGKNQ